MSTLHQEFNPSADENSSKPIESKDFFVALFRDCEGRIELRQWSNVPGEEPSHSETFDDAETVALRAKAWDRDRVGTGFGVATRKQGVKKNGKLADTYEVPALWLDIDHSQDKAADRRILESCYLTPSAIVDSGGGLHAYWFLDEPFDVADATDNEGHPVVDALLGLYWAFNSDRSVCDLARIMRAPGTTNTKYGEPIPCRVLSLDPGRRYSFDDLTDWLSWQSPLRGEPVVDDDLARRFRDAIPERVKGLDVDKALAEMVYPGNLHDTQIRVAASLAARGVPEDEAVDKILEATRRTAGEHGRKWNWYSEQETIRLAYQSGLKKFGESSRKAASSTDASNTDDDGHALGKKNKKKGPSEKQNLLRIGQEATYWRDADGDEFATIAVGSHCEHHRVRSREFQSWLRREYGERHRITLDGVSMLGAPAGTAFKEACDALAAQSWAADAPVHKAPLRTIEHNGEIWIDMGDPDWRVIRVNAEGWAIVDRAPVPIARGRKTSALPMPSRDSADIGGLWEVLPIRDDDRMLLVVWLLSALIPGRNYPILSLSGEQSAGKSWVSTVCRRFTDPAGDPAILEPPRDEADLASQARHNRVLPFDNFSRLPAELADSLCRLATGAELGGRAKYTDHDLATFQAARPIIINGIPELATRPDLASRCLPIRMGVIAERKSDERLTEMYERVAPSVMAALLDAVSLYLRTRSTVPEPVDVHRLMRVAHIAACTAPAFGWEAKSVLAAIRQSKEDHDALLVEGDVVARVAAQMLPKENTKGFTGTASELLEKMNGVAGGFAIQGNDWPKSPNHLTDRLRRAAPALRTVGVHFTTGKTNGSRYVRLTRNPAELHNDPPPTITHEPVF